MRGAIALGVLFGAISGPAQAGALKIRCEHPSPPITNVYRYEITIDLSRKIVTIQQFSTLASNNVTLTYANRKADPGGFLDEDEYAVIADDKIQWGRGKLGDGKTETYDRKRNILDDSIAKYQCSSPR